jgi:hypothetical protein
MNRTTIFTIVLLLSVLVLIMFTNQVDCISSTETISTNNKKEEVAHEQPQQQEEDFEYQMEKEDKALRAVEEMLKNLKRTMKD